jgi:hypothetical protein
MRNESTIEAIVEADHEVPVAKISWRTFVQLDATKLQTRAGVKLGLYIINICYMQFAKSNSFRENYYDAPCSAHIRSSSKIK